MYFNSLYFGLNIMKKFLYIITIIAFLTTHSSAELFMTRDQALETAFPGSESVEKIDIFLNENQTSEIEKISRAKLESKIYIFYKFSNGDDTLGYAVLNTHLLRTKSETVMYVIGNDGRLINAEILAFFEPSEYMQSEKWLMLFENEILDDELRIDRGIPNITGATLTTHAFTKSVRKVLAIFEVAIKEGTN